MTEPQYGQQTGVGSNELAEFIYRFEEAWERSPTPTLVTFLPPESVPWRQPVLMELVKVDQERRWRQGEHRLLESYLDDWPELRGSTNVLSELLEAECLTRAVIDTIPHIFELQSRFPAIGSQIKLEAIEDQARKELRCQKQESRGPTKFPDSTVTRYQLRTVHEEGGLGRIWIADDKSLNRRVALKEVKPQLAHEAQAQQRLFREAQITGQLEHPNIVPIYELNRGASESPFYTMRFVPGTTLQEAIAAYHDDMERGTSVDQLGLRRLLGYFTSVCDAVAYAHSRHVIHRDLKPENVAIGDFGEVVVLDWGLAKVFDSSGQGGQVLPVLDQDAQSTESVIGGRIGTPAYMSPEQAAGCNDQVDKATDIYGLGTILFHILCGGPPHQGDSPQDVLADIASKPTPRVRAVCAQVSPPLAAICEKAMARRKGDRYFSAADLALDVQACHYPSFDRSYCPCETHSVKERVQFLVAAPDGLPTGFAVTFSTEKAT